MRHLTPTAQRRQPTVTTSVVRFTVAGVVVTLALAVVLGALARSAGLEQGMRSAERVARVVAHGVVVPLLGPALVDADEAARARLRTDVAAVAASSPVTGLSVLADDGEVLWSDDRSLVGQQVDLPAEAREALAEGSVVSAVVDADRPGTSDGTLLEVYVGVRDSSGRPLLVDVHQDHAAVMDEASAAWWTFAPPSLAALLLLQLVQVPFAWRLARQVREHQESEAAALQWAVDASEAERRRIAGEVHDGVVQDLTGITFELDAARRSRTGGEDDPELVTRTADRLRQSVAELRTLLVDLNPPRLPDAGLGPALDVLADGLRRSGARVDLDVRDADRLPRPVAALLYRCALEALRNVSAHSGAGHVEITVRHAGRYATLVVDDDGRGFDEALLAARGAHGHVGLQSLGDRLAAVGGTLTAASAPGDGTRLLVRVPLDLAGSSAPLTAAVAEGTGGSR
ncbi:sensor histidine kinase [Geodermatophilus sp. CPCC 205761]|uniref:sensor histidine kinase n=1 Tax=Geodermatophilus sp. CPCC 205761 TaxID=2936597 RepID=UPI003EF02F6A